MFPKFGICPLSVIPVRSHPADPSEIVTQVLFGETFQLLTFSPKKTKTPNWVKIRCSWDKYEGWISTKQFKALKEKEYQKAQENPSYCLELTQGAMSKSHYVPILLGATLPKYDGLHCRLAKQKYTFSGQVINPNDIKPNAELVLKLARKYLYAPYLWGGRSPFGIDCSGFTQIVFKMVGIHLLRDASQQVSQGRIVHFIHEAKEGDVAFFNNAKGKTTHVGIICGKNQIIHASGQVRVDYLDHYGIYNNEQKRYTHRLRLVKRMFE